MIVVRCRLRNQQLAGASLHEPDEVVGWFGAAQAQDYAGAKWGVAQRAIGLTDVAIDRAFDAGAILRTHILRPTWHFVTPADIRWMLALTAPRVHQVSAYYYRQQALDAAVFTRTRKVLERTLRDGRHLTRREVAAALLRAGIDASGLRLGLPMMHAELEGVICSGARRGKQQTYALLAERSPGSAVLPRDEALCALARRYFSSHGPATVRDFVWWSGLTVKDAKRAVAGLTREVRDETVAGCTLYAADWTPAAPAATPLHLLPIYDEYLIAYKDRHLVVTPPGRRFQRTRPNDAYAHHLIVNGRLAGAWTRTVGRTSIELEVRPYQPLTRAAARALKAAVERYAQYTQTGAKAVIAVAT